MRSKLAGINWSTDVEGATLDEVEAQGAEAWLAFAGEAYADRLLTIDVSPSVSVSRGDGTEQVLIYSGSAYVSIR